MTVIMMLMAVVVHPAVNANIVLITAIISALTVHSSAILISFDRKVTVRQLYQRHQYFHI